MMLEEGASSTTQSKTFSPGLAIRRRQIKQTMKLPTLFLSIFLLVGVCAFQPSPQLPTRTMGGGVVSSVIRLRQEIPSSSSKKTELFQAKLSTNNSKTKNNKKKNSAAVSEKVEKEQPSGIALLFAYMTPWRNPNSIFVYMFGLLYALGKYSESHPHQ